MPDQDATQAALTQPIPAGTPMLDGFNPEGKTVGDYIEFANNQYKLLFFSSLILPIQVNPS